MMENGINLGQYAYYDNVNFKAGISRSGCFSIKESQLLEQYGERLSSLLSGNIPPCSADEETFVNTICQNGESSMYAVKLWRKYQEAIAATHRKASPFSSKHNNEVSQFMDESFSSELAM
ncbi:hypothetical protein C2869_00635 [Saccharobesus litoralis]|uniref:Macrodomain Ori protein n=1 Tax=Saccharobesus litoralis TaxID=2172099 RepID=A0A2S0VLF7_9ALTE|nr:DUF413 domain-containing protein [Saccharobesus litoralis]AWB65037.1 hypothetical protein C2869_00635 [Saccharobesus litoralis]